MTERIGNSFVIFGYNGCDGVVTDKNGLIYMRARYYSPEMRRFINADILHGEISDSTSLNRYSYVNGNPVSFVDPFGLEAQRDGQVAKTHHTLQRISSFTDYDLIFTVNAISSNGQWINVMDPKVTLVPKNEVWFELLNKLEEIGITNLEVKFFTYELSKSDFSISFDDDNIVLNSTVTVGVYIEPFDFINIHFHDLESNHTLYWGAP